MGVLETDEGGLQFVRLKNGRRICYREDGVPGQEAERQLMVIHGYASSRLAGMPGVSGKLLKAYRVRLVVLDRPGYGRSDIDRNETFKSVTEDIEELADSLEMGDKIWLLGYSGGGAFCWACARYIPNRIAGMAGWAPMGNYYWKGITDEDRRSWWGDCTPTTKFLFGVGRMLPHFVIRLYTKYLVNPGPEWMERLQRMLSKPDQEHLRLSLHVKDGTYTKDSLESVTWNRGYGMYKDATMWNQNWGFEPKEAASAYKGKYHIWQGTEDNLVPIGLQRWVKNNVPELVELHELPNEGHLSWFCYKDESHHRVFEILFGESIEVEM